MADNLIIAPLRATPDLIPCLSIQLFSFALMVSINSSQIIFVYFLDEISITKEYPIKENIFYKTFILFYFPQKRKR